jgi:hypothetical protein
VGAALAFTYRVRYHSRLDINIMMLPKYTRTTAAVSKFEVGIQNHFEVSILGRFSFFVHRLATLREQLCIG